MKSPPLPAKKDQVVDALLAALTLAATLLFVAHGLRWTGFWYDESVQYWISRGLHPFGPPHQNPGGLADMMKQNGTANLDPGGFSLLLHFWLQAGTGAAWQRALPLMLFVSGMAGLGWLGWRWRRSARFTLFSALVPASFPLLLDYANEIRAYSMEFAGVIWGCLVLDLLLENPRRGRCFAGGLVLGIFLSSRYSYALVAAAISAVFLCATALQPAPASIRLQRILFFLAPLAAIGLAILIGSLLPQYHARIQADGGRMIDYLAPHKASGAGGAEILGRLARNLFSPAALPLTMGAVAACLILRGRPERSLALSRASQYFVAFLAVVITAALWKWHPWNIGTKWSSYLQALSAVMIVRLSADALQAGAAGGRWTRVRDSLEQPALALAIGVLAALIALHRRPPAYDLVPALEYLSRAKPLSRQVSVDVYSYPTLRYFFDEGPFAGKRYYPRAFQIPLWADSTRLIGGKTRYLITHRHGEELARSYPGVRFMNDPALPAGLLRVAPPQASAAPPQP